MSEIKHTFQAGKMNKDLDERLVPNGEYRHAENIQVRTTDGSDVGTIQNIKSTSINSIGSSGDSLPITSGFGETQNATYYNSNWMNNNISDGEDGLPHPIASVVDEKKDKIYFFYSSPKLENHVWDEETETNEPRFYTDTIVEQDVRTSLSKYIVVDNYAIIVSVSSFFQNFLDTTAPFSVDFFNLWSSYDADNESTDNNYATSWPFSSAAFGGGGGKVRVGMTMKIMCEDDDGEMIDALTLDGKPSPRVMAIENSQGGNSMLYMDKDFDLDYFTTSPIINTAKYIIFEQKKALNFNNTITGINVIDNLLFWTDGSSAPKKINIDRCEAGTNINGYLNNGKTQTRLYIDKSNEEYVDCTEVFQGPIYFPNDNNLKEEHITTIRRAPKTPPHLVMKSNTRDGVVGGFDISYQFVNNTNLADIYPGDFRVIQNSIFSTTLFRKDDIIIFTDDSGESSNLGIPLVEVKV